MAARLPGTRSAVFESLGGEPWLRFTKDADALAARYEQTRGGDFMHRPPAVRESPFSIARAVDRYATG